MPDTPLDIAYEVAVRAYRDASDYYEAVVLAQLGAFVATTYPEADELHVLGEYDAFDGELKLRAQKVTAGGQMIAGYLEHDAPGDHTGATGEGWDDFTDEVDGGYLSVLVGLANEEYLGEHAIPVPGAGIPEARTPGATLDAAEVIDHNTDEKPAVCIMPDGQTIHVFGYVDVHTGDDAVTYLQEEADDEAERLALAVGDDVTDTIDDALDTWRSHLAAHHDTESGAGVDEMRAMHNEYHDNMDRAAAPTHARMDLSAVDLTKGGRGGDTWVWPASMPAWLREHAAAHDVQLYEEGTLHRCPVYLCNGDCCCMFSIDDSTFLDRFSLVSPSGQWCDGNACPCHLMPTGEVGRYPDEVIDLDAVAAAVRMLGVPCVIEQTGGNVATLYAGPNREIVAGPGAFLGRNFTLPRASLEDFAVSVGEDDTEPTVIDTGTVDEIAMVIAGAANRLADERQVNEDRYQDTPPLEDTE